MYAGRFRFFKLLFWWSMFTLIKKPASVIDWFHQYTLGKLLMEKLNRDSFIYRRETRKRKVFPDPDFITKSAKSTKKNLKTKY